MLLLRTLGAVLIALGMLVSAATIGNGVSAAQATLAIHVSAVETPGSRNAAIGGQHDACACAHPDAASHPGCGFASIIDAATGRFTCSPAAAHDPPEAFRHRAGLNPHADPPPPKAS